MHHITLVVMFAVMTLSAAACDGDGASDAPAATPAATAGATIEPRTVAVAVTAGCDRPEPERGTEALALVRVTNASGEPVLGAEVDGEIEGPGVVRADATDTTTDQGEALLLFPVSENGDYTITITRVSGLRGEEAVIDASSTSAITFTVGDVCARP